VEADCLQIEPGGEEHFTLHLSHFIEPGGEIAFYITFISFQKPHLHHDNLTFCKAVASMF
jgi:hypothetical protein